MTIATRVGRLLERSTRAAALFDVKVEADSGGFARLLWRACIQLTEAEAAFHIHKPDLAVHPVWHQKERRVQAQPGLLIVAERGLLR